MKKWLDDSLYSHKSENSTNEKKHDSEETPMKNEYELSNTNCSNQGASKSTMGLGVSSEPVPPITSPNEDEMPVSQCSSASPSRYSSENSVSAGHSSMAFFTSLNNRIQVSSPCHHFSPQTVSVQLHNSKPNCSSTRVKEPPHLMTLMSPLKYSSEHSKQIKSVGENKHSIYQSPESSFKKVNENSTSSNSQSTNNTQGLAISLPSFYPANDSGICHVHCPSKKNQSSQLSMHSNDNVPVESSSESESRPGSVNETWCGMGLGLGLLNQQPPSQGDFDASILSNSRNNTQSQSLTHSLVGNGVTHATSGASNSSGCGHWCSACRVRVQVEVACVPGSQRSPSGNRRGIRTLSFPKRVRHKVKAPTKDLNGTHKKKKSPWSFRLNCRLRSNKNDTEQDASVSGLNVGCVSCVCPGYRRADTEPVYRSNIENSSSTNSIALNNPMVDLSRLNPAVFPLHDLEDSARIERAREMAEGVEPPPGFIPLLRETSNSLALPLTYNSMLDLQVLLESSLRLGLGGSGSSGITYPEGFMRHVGPFASETTFLSRTVHTQVDYIHCLVPDLLTITNCGFYWGKMDRYEAERLLDNKPEGTFLLRDSAQEEYLFSVSFRRYEGSLHARIEQWNHKFSFDSHDPGVFASHTVCGLIEHYKDPSCCMFFEPLLTNPLARTFPFSLQHLCRASICSKTTYDGINNLELPKTLKNYLKEYHYKQRVRVRHLD